METWEMVLLAATVVGSALLAARWWSLPHAVGACPVCGGSDRVVTLRGTRCLGCDELQGRAG